jgi:hypothetical protein
MTDGRDRAVLARRGEHFPGPGTGRATLARLQGEDRVNQFAVSDLLDQPGGTGRAV